jgi:hypothetical protein
MAPKGCHRFGYYTVWFGEYQEKQSKSQPMK